MLQNLSEAHLLATIRNDSFVHIDEPLQLGKRLDGFLAAVRNGERLYVFLLLRDPAFLFQILDKGFAGFERLHACVSFDLIRNPPVLADDVQGVRWNFGSMSLPDLVVDLAVKGREAKDPRPEGGVDQVIGDHGDSDRLPARPDDIECLPDEVLKTFVVRMDGKRAVAQFRLRSAGRNEDGLASRLLRTDVFNGVERRLLVDIFRSRRPRWSSGEPCPSSPPARPVDEAVLIHLRKHFVHTTIQHRIHRVERSRVQSQLAPIFRTLRADDATVFFHEFRDALYQFLASELGARIRNLLLLLDLLITTLSVAIAA